MNAAEKKIKIDSAVKTMIGFSQSLFTFIHIFKQFRWSNSFLFLCVYLRANDESKGFF